MVKHPYYTYTQYVYQNLVFYSKVIEMDRCVNNNICFILFALLKPCHITFPVVAGS